MDMQPEEKRFSRALSWNKRCGSTAAAGTTGRFGITHPGLVRAQAPLWVSLRRKSAGRDVKVAAEQVACQRRGECASWSWAGLTPTAEVRPGQSLWQSGHNPRVKRPGVSVEVIESCQTSTPSAKACVIQR